MSAAHIPSVLASLVRYWWNAVQFPASEKTAAAGLAGDPQTSREPWLGWAQIGLMLIAAVFVLSNLGYPLIDQDETRYAEIPREMLATGNWVLPQLNFEPYYDKPPLLYWLCAISYRLFGISEWSARIVPGLAALATLAATMMFGSRHFGKKAGLISGTVLMLSAGFVFSSRYLLIDGVFSLLVSLSLFASYEAIRGPRFKPQWWMVAAISCGLACLAKGPVALVLFVFPVAAHTSLTKTCVPFRLRHYLWAFGIVGAVSVPWLIAVSRLDSGFLLEFIYTHNVRRFAGDFHARPFWFFVPVLLVAGHPWSFLAVPYARFMLSGDAQMRACRSPSLGFLLLWSGWCFLFFSLSKCKLPTYLLPAAPALALLVGQYFDRILTTLTDHTSVGFARLWSARAATVTTSLVGIGFIAYAFFAGITVSFAVFLWGLLWVTILCGSLLTIGDRRHHRFAWGISAVLTFLLAVMVMHQVLPAYGRAKTIFGPGSPLIGRMEEADELPIATIAHEFSEVPFYLKRSDVVHLPSSDTERLIEWAGNTRDGLVVLDTDVALNRLRAGLPQGTMIRRLGKRGRAYLLHLHLPDRPLRFSQNPRKLSKH